MITIITPTLNDLDSILKLWNETDEYHVSLDPEYYTPVGSDKDVPTYLKKAIEHHDPEIRCAMDDGEIAGFITFAPGKADYFDTNIKEYGEIIELYVSPDHRKKGIGQQLMKAAEDHFRSLGLRWTKLQMSEYNEMAKMFYNSQGFTHKQSLLFKKIGE